MFAILVVPLVGIVGAAVDYSNAYRAKERVQTALDATALAVNRSMGTIDDGELREMARSTFATNLGSRQTASLSAIDISADAREVTLKASTTVRTLFMDVLGVGEMAVTAESTTIAGGQTLEVALVLDNSGSMSGRRIADLKKAAQSLTATLFAGDGGGGAIKVGVVPFAAAVNVGPQHRGSGWIDANAVSPIHAENFSEEVSRFELYDNILNDDWAGCVETRPYPLDVRDTPPSPDMPESYFVPMFAPDEPDGRTNTLNNYVFDQLEPTPGSGDDEGRGRRRGKGKSTRGDKGGKGADEWDWDTAQMNVEKYFEGVTVKHGYAMSSHTGPSMMCESTPITPLTGDRDEVDRALARMGAFGMTNIHEGVMWGWRVLSPESPFTEGAPRGEDGTQKIVVLMTDGANTHYGIDSPNMSMYSAYGFARNGRLGPPTSSTNTLVERMNGRTREACANAKSDNVTIYTIAFDLDNSVTRDLLRDCASAPEMAFTPNDGSELIAAFQGIAEELSNLRIAK